MRVGALLLALVFLGCCLGLGCGRSKETQLSGTPPSKSDRAAPAKREPHPKH